MDNPNKTKILGFNDFGTIVQLYTSDGRITNFDHRCFTNFYENNNCDIIGLEVIIEVVDDIEFIKTV